MSVDPVGLSTIFLEVADKLGILEKAKNRLLGAPDVASAKLEAVLEEVAKLYRVLDEMLAEYLSLSFDPTSQRDEKKVLLRLEGGQLIAEVEGGRPHCFKIYHLYGDYLSPWFARVLKPDEQRKLQELFHFLGGADQRIIDTLRLVAEWLTKEARAVLDLVNENKLDEANLRIRAARKEVQPLRAVASKTMSRLYQLQAEFIARA